jgi:hypothetical protein
VIEQGKSGDLCLKTLRQLREIYRRIDPLEWGTVKSLTINEMIESTITLGD